ncbi:MAG: gliding motility-associated C-terminal domain-containing protein [Bacteroidia bacterium]|nr:gliding motility-associated C-terminal domain-containing protein [Bacteroidia bacterium]
MKPRTARPIFTLISLLFLTAASLSAQCNLSLGNDTLLCTPGPLTLVAGNGYNSRVWNTGSTAASINAPTAGIYWCQVTCLTGNLVTNGDFSGGNTGFSSNYIYSTNLNPEGRYWVGPNANTVHPGFQGTAHGGSGNFMVVNGSGTPGSNVWCQTINVVPNTNYNFSTWVTSVVGSSPALLQFNINGSAIGPIFTAPNTTWTWTQFNAVWNSGAATTATICIVNQNTNLGGNDFGLDDITFTSVLTQRDSITISYAPQLNIDLGPDTLICDLAPLTLDAGFPGNTYAWSTGGTNQTETVSGTGTFSVVVTDPNGCTFSDAINVTYSSTPTVNLGPDQVSCYNVPVLLNAGNAGSSFLWNNASTSQTLSASATGQYFVAVTNPAGCVGHDTVNVTLPPPFNVNIGPDLIICDNTPQTLDAGNPGKSYLWNSGATTQTVTITTSGNHSVTVTDAYGCSFADTMNALFATPPTVNLGPDIVKCDGLAANLSAGNPGMSYLWNSGNTSQVLVASTSGLYWVQVTDGNGCTGRDSVNVVISQYPTVTLPPDTVLCEGHTWLIQPVVNGAISYQWQDGNTNLNYMVTTPGTYQLTVTSTWCGTASDQTTATYDFVRTFDLGPDTSVCEGRRIRLNASPNSIAVTWNDGDQNNQKFVDQAGIYWAQTTQYCGTFRDSVEVTLLPLPEIELGPNRTWCPGEAFEISAEGPYIAWIWQDSTTLPFIMVSAPGSIHVTVTDPNGCENDDNLRVERGDCPVGLFVPTAFSPNGDGLNDYFFPVEKDLTVTNVMVFDRWGKLLFEAKSAYDHWDGTFRNNALPEGVYTYVISYVDRELIPGKKAGSVTLIR